MGLSTIQNDKKPFKGKGGAEIPVRLVKWKEREFRHHEQIVEEMKALSKFTKANGGKAYYAMLHKRNDGPCMVHTLRWRSYGEKAFHRTWEDMQEAINQMSPEMQAYYLETNLKMEFLNAEEQGARGSLKLAVRTIAHFEAELEESIVALCIN